MAYPGPYIPPNQTAWLEAQQMMPRLSPNQPAPWLEAEQMMPQLPSTMMQPPPPSTPPAMQQRPALDMVRSGKPGWTTAGMAMLGLGSGLLSRQYGEGVGQAIGRGLQGFGEGFQRGTLMEERQAEREQLDSLRDYYGNLAERAEPGSSEQMLYQSAEALPETSAQVAGQIYGAEQRRGLQRERQEERESFEYWKQGQAEIQHQRRRGERREDLEAQEKRGVDRAIGREERQQKTDMFREGRQHAVWLARHGIRMAERSGRATTQVDELQALGTLARAGGRRGEEAIAELQRDWGIDAKKPGFKDLILYLDKVSSFRAEFDWPELLAPPDSTGSDTDPTRDSKRFGP